MTDFKIEYLKISRNETISADRHEVDGEWIVFASGNGGDKRQHLRVRAEDVKRISVDDKSE